MTPRITQLRQRHLDTIGYFWERNLLWAQGMQQWHHLPRALRAAHALRHLVENVSIEIGPGELIVGAVPMSDPPADKKEDLEAAAAFMDQHSVHAAFNDLMSPQERAGIEAYAYTACPMNGHTTINNEKVLQLGLLGIRGGVQERLAALDPLAPEDTDRRLFYEACLVALEAAMRFAERYAELAEELAARETDPMRAAELEQIARTCRTVPAHPAGTFQEALQSVWFMHWLVAAEHGNSHFCFCPGRTDRYCYPALKSDLESRRLSRQQALELLESFLINYNRWGRFAPPQVMIIGGQHPDGSDATNELTYLCLEACREVRFLHPSLAISYHKGTPDKLLVEAVETLRSGCGYPCFFNDEVIVPGLLDIGVPREEAVHYIPCSCVEITVAGRCNAWVASGYHNWGKMLELALNDGVDPATGRQTGPRTGQFTQMMRFDDFKEAVKQQIRHFVEMEVRSYNLLDKLMGEMFPVPLLSCVVEDCLEKGKDYFAGGARYNFIEPEAVGPTNVADSLAAVRRLVFEDGSVTRQELLTALERNFEGCEGLRQRLIHGAPKFGNDEDEVDGLMVELVDLWYSEVRKHRNHRGGPYLPGFLCWVMHARLGEHVGALPDGRRAGEALAPHLGPSPGRDRHGPTAVINSVAKTDLSKALSGVVLNLKFLPDQLQGDSRERFLALLRTGFEKGIFEVQITLADSQTLRAAQEKPAEYGDLVVRVGGYSACFTALDKTLQDEVIARTELTV